MQRLFLALAATVSIGAAHAADLCCDCGTPCAPRAHAYVKPFYIVDQGPVYGGRNLPRWHSGLRLSGFRVALLGLFSVMTYIVSLQTHDIGIRLALA